MIVFIQNEPIDEAALLAAFARGSANVGAVVSFSGRVRTNDGVSALELESCPGLTEVEIEREAAKVAAEHSLLSELHQPQAWVRR